MEIDHTETKRKTIEQRIEDEQSLILLSNGEPTRYNSSDGSFSAIDLTFTNSIMAISLNWQMLTSYGGSDHWLVEIRMHNKNALPLDLH